MRALSHNVVISLSSLPSRRPSPLLPQVLLRRCHMPSPGAIVPDPQGLLVESSAPEWCTTECHGSSQRYQAAGYWNWCQSHCECHFQRRGRHHIPPFHTCASHCMTSSTVRGSAADMCTRRPVSRAPSICTFAEHRVRKKGDLLPPSHYNPTRRALPRVPQCIPHANVVNTVCVSSTHD